MSVRIDKNLLTQEQKELIRKLLCFYPKEEPQYGKEKYFYRQKEQVDPILFFELDSNIVQLPFTFGNTLLQSFPNLARKNLQMPFRFTGSLKNEQKEMIDEAVTHLRKSCATILNAYTGSGKTIMGAWLAANIWGHPDLCEMVLIIHPFTVLNASWASTFREFTDARVWIVEDEPPPQYMPNVIVCYYERINKIPKVILQNIGFLIIDEADKLCIRSAIEALLATEPKYILGESATMVRESDGMEVMMHSLCGTNLITRISTKPFTVIKFMTGIKATVETSNWDELLKDLYANPIRNAIIVNLIKDNIAKGYKIIFLTLRQNHVKTLFAMLKEMDIKCDIMLDNKKTYSDSDCLLGTVSKIGVGFDEKMACPDFNGKNADLLIYSASTKKASGIEQHFGRVTRSDYPSVIHLVDDNKIIKSHWTICKKWYESRNGTIHTFKMPKQIQVYNTDGTCAGSVIKEEEEGED